MTHDVIIYGISNIALRIVDLLEHTDANIRIAIPEGLAIPTVLQSSSVAITSIQVEDLHNLKKLDIQSAKAIIITSDNELFNLKAALHAISLNQEIYVIIRLFNLNLAKKLQKNIKNFKVLSVSQVSSPTFAIAALIKNIVFSFKVKNRILCFYEADGRQFKERMINEIENEEPVKIISVNDNFFPKADYNIKSDDKLLIFSDFNYAKKYAALDLIKETDTGFISHSDKKIIKNIIKNILNDRILITTILFLIFITLFATIYFQASENLPFITSLYFVITTLTTVGFGDISLKDSSVLSKFVGMFVMFSGVTLSAMIFSMITDNLIKKRMDLMMGRKKLKIKNHVILCAIGDVGSRILENLIIMGEKVVVIEKDADNKFLQIARSHNIPFIISDATLEETLINANIKEAKSIICATDDDIQNLEIGLNSRNMNKNIKIILRVFDMEFAKQIENKFGIDMALSSSYIAAPAFACAYEDMSVLNILNIGESKLFLKEQKLHNEEIFYDIVNSKNIKLLFQLKDNNFIFKDYNYCENSILFYLEEK